MTETNEHTLAEAAALIGMAPTTLRDRCTRHAVPHHRRFEKRGIYFTDDDIAAIRAGHSRPVPAVAAARPGDIVAGDGDALSAALDRLTIRARSSARAA